jgi:hypothetical protein
VVFDVDQIFPSWTKAEVRMLKSLTREKTKVVIARKLNRSVDAIYGLASRFGVMLGGDRGRKGRAEQTLGSCHRTPLCGKR